MADPRILIVDDEPNLLESFKVGLELKGYDVSVAPGGAEALEACENNLFDVVLLDIRMPKMDGVETLRNLMGKRPDQIVIMLTAHSSLESAVEAGRLGAFDYLEKPSTADAVHLRVQRALERRDLSAENQRLRSQLRDRYRFKELIGNSPAMQAVYSLIERILPTESTVLISGETGTGKELAARAIHYNGPRADERFYALHCAAIPEELLESELFGHEKGAFTGAISSKIGVFEAADGGTLFLDEVGEMSMAAQVRLLRVLQEKEFIPVGSTTPRKTDVRLIAATNRNLSDEVKNGRFREDLFYRLNVIDIRLPSLSERRDDIPLLIQHFLEKYATEGRKHRFSEDALNCLARHDWPGNVRELENLVERALALSENDILEVVDLPEDLGGNSLIRGSGASTLAHRKLQEARETFEIEYIRELLTQTGGNITHASKMAGIAWQNFHQKLKKYSIDAKSFAPKKEKKG